MKQITLVILIAGIFLTGCSALPGIASKCNDDILRRFTQTEVAKAPDLVYELESTYEGYQMGNKEWKISARGENGCVVQYFVEKNGQTVQEFQYYINLETETIHADNPLSADALQIAFMNRRDLDIQKGYPLPK